MVFLVLAFDTATIIPLEAFAIFYTTVYSILPSLAGGLSLSIKKFNLVNIGERAGSGIPNIYAVWKKQG